MDKIPMTVQGHKTLTAEFEHRTANERRRIIDAIAEARAHGDLSENAEYSAAKEQQSLNEGRIKELETILALADIIDVAKLTGSSVKFGATVTYLDEDTEEEKTYQVVGDPEADASAGRISISSPIARAMIGKSEGDSFEVAAPGGARTRRTPPGRPRARRGARLPTPTDGEACPLPSPGPASCSAARPSTCSTPPARSTPSSATPPGGPAGPSA
jgi:transcription elongation factor GreA